MRARILWKRFAESATGYAARYASDPFFKTEVNVIALHTLFALLVVSAVTISYVETSRSIGTGLSQSTSNNINAADALIAASFEQMHYERTRNTALVLALVVGTTILMGLIIARISLRPARNALVSQKQFIGNIAHELRTPLTTIKTNIEVALFDRGMKKEFQDLLHSNVEELDRISEIINNLISLSASLRPERMTFTNVDVTSIVNNVVSNLSRLATQKSQRITVDSKDSHMVWGNRAALEQITTNILKNAISYTQNHGSITATVDSYNEESVLLKIEDTGRGIPKKVLSRLFEPYYREDPSRQRQSGIGGSGLGLTIVHELVKLQNGTISIQSTEGKGTRVFVLLPKGRKVEQSRVLGVKFSAS